MEQLTAGLVGALVATVVTLGVSFAQMRQAKTSQRVLAQQEITAKYDRMVDYRLLKPEVLTLAHHWTPRCFAAIYDQKSDADRGWAYYYGYIELPSHTATPFYMPSRRGCWTATYTKWSTSHSSGFFSSSTTRSCRRSFAKTGS